MKYNNNVSNACKASIKANDSPITWEMPCCSNACKASIKANDSPSIIEQVPSNTYVKTIYLHHLL
jgi:hypothetical protein